jgi:hypothetical protein
MKKMAYAAIIAVASLIACEKSVPDGVIIVQGARTTSSYSFREMYRMEYHLEEKYPAKNTLSEISSQLKKRGWKPLDHFFLYPLSETSELTGWIYYRDPPKAPTWMVYAWSGDWENANHDVVSYTLRYSDPIAKYNRSVFFLNPDTRNLIVTVIYMPSEAAKKLRAEKQKKRS